MGADAFKGPERAWVDAIRRQLDKMLETSAFAGSKKLSQLLVFLVDQAIEGRSFNEYSIALDVFQKGESFDPRLDPVVRVYVRRLRDKLNQYRTTAGLQDPVEIVLPPRTYVPLIRMRPTPALARFQDAVGIQRNIAVRSFRCLSREKEDEYFCDGLVEEIVHAMAKLKQLRVIPVAALEAGAAASLSARELHDQFRVEAVLSGNVCKGPSTLRVATQLTNATDGTLIWSEIYHRAMGDVLMLQAKIANAIAYALCRRMELVRTEEPRRTRNNDVSNRADDVFLLRSKAGEG